MAGVLRRYREAGSSGSCGLADEWVILTKRVVPRNTSFRPLLGEGFFIFRFLFGWRLPEMTVSECGELLHRFSAAPPMCLAATPLQQGSVPELDGSPGVSHKMAASRFGEPKLPGGLSPSSDMRGLSALLPVICSKTHKRRRCKENLVQHLTTFYGHFLSTYIKI
ncbi:hypothetical protein [Phosphitispora fastidiosa]|uniref:hypothetical protein n=1 Tax=Phosphitispora fastidiosa TaxID=2837202 RepID=UPI001E407C11|nr:hypothetical protein [Phosphitispora fastidiosa]MBU7007207.1 hypothetical protein [Phosphitispora fastidiosa]